MKLKYSVTALFTAVSLFVVSCVEVPSGGYGYGNYGYSNGYGYNSSVAWTNASYDANGFPIFGYSYGRPVYGYTQAGAAIFTIAALTALCFVPRWKPASWYRGSWSYPANIHRVAAPPKFPADHRPNIRPQGGENAPIHRNPAQVFNAQRPNGQQGNSPFGSNANRPNGQQGNSPFGSNANRPNSQQGNSPFGNNANRANSQRGNSPTGNNASRPGNQRSAGSFGNSSGRTNGPSSLGRSAQRTSAPSASGNARRSSAPSRPSAPSRSSDGTPKKR